MSPRPTLLRPTLHLVESMPIMLAGASVRISTHDSLSSNLMFQEKEADAFASNTLTPDDVFETFARVRPLFAQRVQAFAAKQEIVPGIVVGRLQHERLLPYNQLNHLKLSLAWTASA